MTRTTHEQSKLLQHMNGRKFDTVNILERFGRDVSFVHDCWVAVVKGRHCLKKIEVRRTRSTTEREYCRIRRMAVAHRTASSEKIQASLGPRVTYQKKQIDYFRDSSETDSLKRSCT
ncbi:hypothetical protein AVEN_224483-1 [Araneus ventricosus]|uniref:Uncharacterized protein n=1 Tax=Araneus ventricosus TaxID=182803 RepID=A0A4Y2GI37_ARAVE|nr:hypothetical protein AVEN_224483-1 [Araneus ventricosus]